MEPVDPGAKSPDASPDASPTEAAPQPASLSPRARFALAHVTGAGLSAFFLLCALAVLPSMFQEGPAPTQELSGHLTGAHLTQGKTKLENSFAFTVKEHAQTFVATGLKEIDQMVFTSEKNGAFLQFEVDTQPLQAGDKTLKVRTLKSIKNVYLSISDTGELAKSRGIAITFFVLFLGAGLGFGLRLRKKFTGLTPEAAATLKLDPLVVLGLNYPLASGAIPFAAAFVIGVLVGGSGAWATAFGVSFLGYGVFVAWYLILGRKLLILQGLRAIHTQTTAYTGERVKTDKPTHVKAVELLVRAGKLDVQSPEGKTPLMMALEKGQWDAAEALIRAGANVNLQAADGTTALAIAAKAKNFPLSNKLVQAGASCLLKNAEGKNAAEIANGIDKNQAVADLLNKIQQAQILLFSSLEGRQMDGLARALATGAKPGIVNDKRMPALAVAVSSGFGEGVRRLIQEGAPVDEALAQAAAASSDPVIQKSVAEAWEKVLRQRAQTQRAAT